VNELACYEIVRALLGCWPLLLLAVAKRLGMPIRALDSYIAGETALDEHPAESGLFANTRLRPSG
jgi:hypothetical protein